MWKIITSVRNFKNLNKINFLQTGTSSRKMSLQCQWEVIVKTTEIHVMTVKGCEPRSKIAGKNLPKNVFHLYFEVISQIHISQIGIFLITDRFFHKLSQIFACHTRQIPSQTEVQINYQIYVQCKRFSICFKTLFFFQGQGPWGLKKVIKLVQIIFSHGFIKNLLVSLQCPLGMGIKYVNRGHCCHWRPLEVLNGDI